MTRLFLWIGFSALAALAAELTGTWKATAQGPNGTMERTFVFKQDGARLTGETTSSVVGKSEIMDGKVDGDNVSFTITIDLRGNRARVNYKGKVTGNEIKLTSTIDSGQSFEWSGKRVE